jgi:hypothetical protein
MSEQRVRVDQSAGFVSLRPIPLTHLLITATTSGSAQTFATVRTGVILRVSRLAVVNVTGGAATLSLHSVPSGGTIGNGNAELLALSVAANTAVDLTDRIGGLYGAGTTLHAYSGTGSALVLHGYAEEVL